MLSIFSSFGRSRSIFKKQDPSIRSLSHPLPAKMSAEAAPMYTDDSTTTTSTSTPTSASTTTDTMQDEDKKSELDTLTLSQLFHEYHILHATHQEMETHLMQRQMSLLEKCVTKLRGMSASHRSFVSPHITRLNALETPLVTQLQGKYVQILAEQLPSAFGRQRNNDDEYESDGDEPAPTADNLDELSDTETITTPSSTTEPTQILSSMERMMSRYRAWKQKQHNKENQKNQKQQQLDAETKKYNKRMEMIESNLLPMFPHLSQTQLLRAMSQHNDNVEACATWLLNASTSTCDALTTTEIKLPVITALRPHDAFHVPKYPYVVAKVTAVNITSGTISLQRILNRHRLALDPEHNTSHDISLSLFMQDMDHTHRILNDEEHEIVKNEWDTRRPYILFTPDGRGWSPISMTPEIDFREYKTDYNYDSEELRRISHNYDGQIFFKASRDEDNFGLWESSPVDLYTHRINDNTLHVVHMHINDCRDDVTMDSVFVTDDMNDAKIMEFGRDVTGRMLTYKIIVRDGSISTILHRRGSHCEPLSFNEHKMPALNELVTIDIDMINKNILKQKLLAEAKVKVDAIVSKEQEWRQQLAVGSQLDVQDTVKRWYTACVIEIQADNKIVISYDGWEAQYNESLERSSKRLAAYHTRARGGRASGGVAHDSQWDTQSAIISCIDIIETTRTTATQTETAKTTTPSTTSTSSCDIPMISTENGSAATATTAHVMSDIPQQTTTSPATITPVTETPAHQAAPVMETPVMETPAATLTPATGALAKTAVESTPSKATPLYPYILGRIHHFSHGLVISRNPSDSMPEEVPTSHVICECSHRHTSEMHGLLMVELLQDEYGHIQSGLTNSSLSRYLSLPVCMIKMATTEQKQIYEQHVITHEQRYHTEYLSTLEQLEQGIASCMSTTTSSSSTPSSISPSITELETYRQTLTKLSSHPQLSQLVIDTKSRVQRITANLRVVAIESKRRGSPARTPDSTIRSLSTTPTHASSGSPSFMESGNGASTAS